ncbi:MAG TPA: isoprenylcysteine carboxylmethyltransferase family protein, partial [Anaeromyxobacteraceae bacterium]|nr:isoprenylcysteine carboxylmethyltransferase family protein [Anaeromyxobacteraceae bacterium]
MTSQALYLAGLALLGLERLVELARSRRNARRAFARGGVEVGRRHFRAMAAMHAAFLASCAAEVMLAGRRFPGALGWAALAGVLAGQALRWWAVHSLKDRWNVRIVVVPGDEPVVSGPYRFVRHPNYVAVVLEIALVPLVHGAWMTALAFSLANGALLAVRIRAEERALGSLYAARFGAVPRFVP